MRERDGEGGRGAKVHVLLSTIISPQDPRGGAGSVTDSARPGRRTSAAYLSSTTGDRSDTIPTEARSRSSHVDP